MALVAAIGALAPALSQASDPPNVVIFLADDLGYADLSCYGDGRVKTPNLDQMTREGMRVTHFYASAGTCSPTRSSNFELYNLANDPRERHNLADKRPERFEAMKKRLLEVYRNVEAEGDITF